MTKYNFLLSLFLLMCLTTLAQRQNLYFLKDNGEYVKLRDSADYLRIVKEPDAGSNLYKVNEYYLDGTNKSAGFSSTIDPPVYEGQRATYFKNGNKKQVGNYTNGKLADTVFNFYPNGMLYTSVIYTNTPVPGPKDKKTPSFSSYIELVRDSTGKDLVVNGNGECVFFDAGFKRAAESGKIKNGGKDGVWTGEMGVEGDKLKYTETYTDGKLISGESIDQQGTVYQYTLANVPSEPAGGWIQYYKDAPKKVKYPPNCLKQHIQGQVLLKFRVLKDGTVSDIGVLKNPHPELTAEAIRVLKTFPKWQPAVKRGKPFNSFQTVPLVFSLKP